MVGRVRVMGLSDEVWVMGVAAIETQSALYFPGMGF
jgi:hypothetical protein